MKYFPCACWIALIFVWNQASILAHDPRTRLLELVEGEIRPEVFVTEADHHEETTTYTVLPLHDSEVVSVAPTTFKAFNAHILFEAKKVGTTVVQVAWDYAPTFASGIHTVVVIVRPAPEDGSGGSFPGSGTQNDPVNTYTGEQILHEPSDLFIPGPMALQFKRYYASGLRRSFVVSRIGDNWRHNYDWSLHFIGNTLTLLTPKGKVIKYIKNNTQTNEWIQQNHPDAPHRVIQVIGETENEFFISTPGGDRILRFGVPTDDQAYRLEEIRNGRGSSIFFTHSRSGELLEVTDGRGRTLTFNYGLSNDHRLTKLVSVSDGTRSIQLNYEGELLRHVQNAAGEQVEYVYDTEHRDSGLLSFKKLANGNIPYRQEWDDRGRVSVQTDAFGNETRFTYSDDGSTTTMLRPDETTVIHQHDSNGRLTKVTDAAGHARNISYDASGHRRQVDQPSGDMQTTDTDARSAMPSRVTNAAGDSISYEYTTIVVPPGFERTELKRVNYPDGLFELYEYNDAGHSVAYTDRFENRWERQYNDLGQLTRAVSPTGAIIRYTYNADGTLKTYEEGDHWSTEHTYDNLKRLVQLTHSDGTSRTFTYDHANRQTSIKDENGALTRFEYDALNRMLRLTNRLDETIDYTYDSQGRYQSVAYGPDQVFSVAYTDGNRLAGFGRPDTETGTVSQFNENDRLSGVEDGNGDVHEYTYDADGLLKAERPPAGPLRVYEHDQLGRTIAYQSSDGESETYEYGANDRISRISLPGLDLSTSLTHNSDGLLTELITPDGRKWNYSYDPYSRMISATDPLDRVTTMEYDGRGRMTRMVFPGSMGDVTLTYDGLGQITSRSFSDGTKILTEHDLLGRTTGTDGVTMNYDAESRMTECNGLKMSWTSHFNQLQTLTYAPGQTVQYQYDHAGKLVSVQDWTGAFMEFSYDANGRTSQIKRSNGTITSLSYDANGRVTDIQHAPIGSITMDRNESGTIRVMTMDLPLLPESVMQPGSWMHDEGFQVDDDTYDAKGRRTIDPNGRYVWDLADRLTSFVGDDVSVDFESNGFGQIVRWSSNGNTTQFTWNYALPLPSPAIQTSPDGTRRFWIPHPSGKLLYSINPATGEIRFPHYDDRGNTLFLTDANAQVLVSYAYSPYGVTESSDSNFDHPFRWSGEYGILTEPVSGLCFTASRIYDSQTCQFLTRESMGPHSHPFTVNPYQYAAGNPLMYIDPLGTDPVDSDAAEAETSDSSWAMTLNNTLRSGLQVAGTFGAELGDKADDLARQAARALGAADILADTANEVLHHAKGGRGPIMKVIDTALAYKRQFEQLDDAAERMARNSNRLKSVARVGHAFTAVSVAAELWKLNDRLGRAGEAHNDAALGHMRAYLAKSATAWELFEKGKKTETWLRAQLNIYRLEMMQQNLWNDYDYLVGGHIHFWTAVGDIYGAFVPGFSFVGTENVANSAHQNIWAHIYGALGD